MILGYPHKQLYEEVAYIAYHFHWPKEEIMELEHRDRRTWVDQIAGINGRLSDQRSRKEINFKEVYQFGK